MIYRNSIVFQSGALKEESRRPDTNNFMKWHGGGGVGDDRDERASLYECMQ